MGSKRDHAKSQTALVMCSMVLLFQAADKSIVGLVLLRRMVWGDRHSIRARGSALGMTMNKAVTMAGV